MKDIALLHRTEYGDEPAVIASAPGRIVLLGDYTGYNQGYILSIAIDRYVQVALSKRKDNSLRFFADDLNERKRTTVSNLKYKREDRWANYVKGVIHAFMQIGCSVCGLNVTIAGDLPQGKGLASSSAMEVAAAVALKKLFSFSMSDIQLLECARQAESRFIGIDTSVVDHLIAYLSKAGNAMVLDTRSLEYRFIPFNFGKVNILITDSNIPQHSVESEYAQRKKESDVCVNVLAARRQGTSLRDYSAQDLRDCMGKIPESIRRRCLHIVEENQRVLDAEDLIRKKDIYSFGKLLNRSHESLRDQYEVSCPEIDWLVKRAWGIDGVYGSRMTGAGFGGCTVTFINDTAMEEYQKRLDEYERIFGFKAASFRCSTSAGAKALYSK